MSPSSRASADETWELVFRLSWMMRERFLELARELGLSPPQAGALQHLDPGSPVAMGELATFLHCDASTVTGLVDRLEARGLVERRVSATDRRVKDVVITGKGCELQDRFREGLRRPPSAMGKLSSADMRSLREILSRALEGSGRATAPSPNAAPGRSPAPSPPTPSSRLGPRR
jgi:DNA-binding MarR family transcriptional regulator